MSNDEKIYQKILKAIVEHQLAPGVRLPEDRLSEAFGVSRTGIRKVLQRLALERFVVIEPNKGAHVNRPTRQEAEEVLRSRILLEPLLIPELQQRWDAQQSERFTQMIHEEKEAEQHGHLSDSIQLTARFHYELAKLAGNSVLADFIEQLCYRSSLVIAAFGSHHSVSCDCGDHAELVTLLNQRETQAAQQWMTHHLHHIRASLKLEQDQTTVIDFQQIFAETTEK